jgi:diguanylate cyclase (GGDEF)-like protein
MALPAFDVAVRGYLMRLADALGGEWALVEAEGTGVRAIATNPGLALELSTPGWNEALGVVGAEGIVIPVGDTQRAHPSSDNSMLRVVVGRDLDPGVRDTATVAVVSILGDVLVALSESGRRSYEERRRADRLELRAATDPLTGLLNRRGWDRTLELEEDRCRRHGLSAEIVVVDLDGLKRINDRLGHDAGDALLVRAATYIFSAVRAHDAVARLGGDEFGIMAVGTDTTGELVGQRIEACLREAEIAASVGAASRFEVASLADTWRLADLRMYRVKQRRRTRRPQSSSVTAGPLFARPEPGDPTVAEEGVVDAEAGRISAPAADEQNGDG